jgi:mono/diheme cytochrome c family protein
MRIVILLVLVGLCACSNDQAADSMTAYGGRLFDNWYEEMGVDFVPDDPATPEADGRGGPNGNGTLNDVNGNPLLNTGHDYRFKNLFGWDLLANEGIYGAAHQAKDFVLPVGPGNDNEPIPIWLERIAKGWNGLPAYGSVLSAAQIASLVDYMLAMRAGIIPGPDYLWDLSSESPKGYVMKSGGSARRGDFYYEYNCASCHGDDGTKILFDGGTQSLGQHARYYGYAVALVTMNGEPASNMGPQLAPRVKTKRQAQMLLDLVAALCDRTRYGVGAATDPDVPDGDIRCGEYLR